ncbi:MAG: DUF4974 domain-containing protein [Chitinophagaceae bacterium]|nr:DUF4974 domain-containing protein [Chitinophagaceae bacterium]
MENPQALIDKLWKGEATVVELDALRKLLSDENNAFRQELLAAYEYALAMDITPRALEPRKAREILERIHHSMPPAAGNKVKLITLKKVIVWAAASIILLVTCTIFLLQRGPFKGNPAKQVVAEKVEENNEPLTIYNNADTVLPITLKDGSLVALEPKSLIWFQPDYNERVRDIHLTGKAFFKVAKVREKPFTVLVKGFNTTALGTQFTINTLGKDMVDVRLLEGRVVVRSTNPQKGDKDVYLLPNQELIGNILTNTVTVTKFKPAQRSGNKGTAIIGQAVDRPESNPDALYFDNEPLTDVFKKLQVVFGATIQFNNEDLADLRLTGSFRKADSLPKILSVISNMNDLAYQEKAGMFIISKKK